MHLSAMNDPKLNMARPWALTFSYGRALQGSVIKAWDGKDANKVKAQKQLLANCQRNGEATKGLYKGGKASQASEFEAKRVY